MSKLSFKKSDSGAQGPAPEPGERIKVIIADDEEEVHAVTRFVLKDFRYEGKKLEFLSAYSGADAKRLLQEHPDASLILLDIVMEQDNSGLEVADFIRNDLDNELMRIIVRTGQPGIVPEEEVINKYYINDYKEKTELTDRKFKSAMTMALRSYADLINLESFKAILEHEVELRTAELIEKNRELERLNRELEYHATRDVLTGAYNRMKFNELLDTEIKRHARYPRAMTLAMIDIDHFKAINDRHGHAGGDSALRQFVALVLDHIRESDILARWGGEEFMILFLEAPIDESRTVSEMLRQRIESHAFDSVGNLTCSVGLTQLQHDDDLESLHRRVDEALYQAKRGGRNQVVCK
jgi:diguanylate cyclase (GGDEF)-like protein